MTQILLKITNQLATATFDGKIVSGTVGLPVNIEYDSSWNNLTKAIYFKNGKQIRKRDNVSAQTTVPWEILRTHGNVLQIGIEGRNASGDVVIPTVWASVSTILEGASGGIPAAPEPGADDNPSGGESKSTIVVTVADDMADYNAYQIRSLALDGYQVVLFDPTNNRCMNFLGVDNENHATFIFYGDVADAYDLYYVYDDSAVGVETVNIGGKIGDIEAALDRIIEIQNGLIGGDSE